jgi:hypothetical protein
MELGFSFIILSVTGKTFRASFETASVPSRKIVSGFISEVLEFGHSGAIGPSEGTFGHVIMGFLASDKGVLGLGRIEAIGPSELVIIGFLASDKGVLGLERIEAIGPSELVIIGFHGISDHVMKNIFSTLFSDHVRSLWFKP